MRWVLPKRTVATLALLIAGCSDGREATKRQTIAKLDGFRELRSWMAEDLGNQDGLRISKSAIGDYVRREHGWEHRSEAQDQISDQQVAEALGLSVDRINRYLDTAESLDIKFAIQFPNDRGYASVAESSGGAWSGCVGLLHWGGSHDPADEQIEDDWYFSWACD